MRSVTFSYAQTATLDFIKIFDNVRVFENPKSVDDIKKLIEYVTTKDDNDIILDFFSGSATTAHAVMQLNAEDGGNRKFICVQLPELCDKKSEAYKAGYKNICEIGKERIRRAGAQIMHNSQCIMHNSQCIMHNSQCIIHNDKRSQDVQCTIHNEEDTQIMLEDNNCELSIMNYELDTGFRVFKLDTSNLKLWDGTPVDEEDYQIMLDRMNDSINSIKEDRTDMDVVYEIMLKMGVPLTYPVLPLELDGVKAYSVGAFW